MSARPLRTWMLITGVVLVVLQGLLALAWWMLPRWMPEQVIAYAPWPEPALRAWRLAGEAGESTDVHGAMEARLLDWGPDIGPALRYQFENGDEQCRLRVVALASEVARADGIKADTTLSEELRQSFGEDGIARLREDLVQLVLAAMADGSSYLPSNASYVAMSLRDPRTVPPACAFLAKQKPPVFEDLEPVIRFLGSMNDPRAVPVLIPLLPIRHKPHPTVVEALDECLDDSTLMHVIAATHHTHEVVRTWAARSYHRYPESADLEERLMMMMLEDGEPQVRVAAIRSLGSSRRYRDVEKVAERLRRMLDDDEQQVRVAAVISLGWPGYQQGARLFDLAQHEEDEPVRVAAIRSLGWMRYLPAAPYIRSLTESPQANLKDVAIVALMQMQDEGAIPFLLPLLNSDDSLWVMRAKFALDAISPGWRVRMNFEKSVKEDAGRDPSAGDLDSLLPSTSPP